MAENIVIEHLHLGRIIGRGGDAVSFLGIPYATLAHRFAEPQVVSGEPSTSPMDATNYGPTTPTPPGAFQLEMAMMQQQGLVEPATALSDLHALNLNITVPYIDGKPALGGKLPVFVWIHGGGFVSGSTSWPQYYMTNMIKLSADNNLPVVGVSVSFRLGALGFLTSKELRDSGCTTNNQLRDQMAALNWIRKHIGGFGGGGDNITLAGESTGAVEVGMFLQMERPLFARAFMSGGSSLLMPPTTPEAQEQVYGRLVRAVGLEAASGEERVRALITMPIEDLMAKMDVSIPWMPMVDGEIVKHAATYAMVSGEGDAVGMPARGWLKSLMVGNCQFDASSMAFFLAHKKAGICRKLSQHLRQSFPDEPSLIDDLLSAYGFPPTLVSAATDDNAGFDAYLHLLNDICYFAPTVTFARGWGSGSKCHAFFINEQNPWDGLFKGKATHIIDVMMLFQNFNDQFPPAMKANAIQFGLDCFTFMYGREPWPACSPDGQFAKVYGPSSWESSVTTPVTEVIDDIFALPSDRRRAMISVRDRIGYDAIAQAVRVFNSS